LNQEEADEPFSVLGEATFRHVPSFCGLCGGYCDLISLKDQLGETRFREVLVLVAVVGSWVVSCELASQLKGFKFY
jgi:hypothetical protein